MKTVRMKTHISGYRDGVEWPPVDGEIDLPDQEADDLVAAGYAKVTATHVDVDETADPDPDSGTDPAPVDLGAMSVKQLRAHADAHEVEIPKGVKKRDDIAEAVRAGLEAKAAAAAAASTEDPDAGTTGDPRGPDGGADRSDGAPAGGSGDPAPPPPPGTDATTTT